MTASVALHEIEKLVPRMEETVKSEPLKREIITDQVDELKQYTEGIISVLRKGGDKDLDVKESINRAFNNYKLKLLDRKISYKIDIEESIKTLKCDKRFFITVLMNLIDNSIYWLDTVYKDSKEIYLKVLKEDESIIILIADNDLALKMIFQNLFVLSFQEKLMVLELVFT